MNALYDLLEKLETKEISQEEFKERVTGLFAEMYADLLKTAYQVDWLTSFIKHNGLEDSYRDFCERCLDHVLQPIEKKEVELVLIH
ncbi:MAG: hypothetical protein H0Z28_11670 [Archaeoglobus sp.]|nr:hypothetical protein [Archaeoglobus sp.]